ncbi:MAG: tetratricopeptide repeat protein [Tateyamaria sp.]|uniref:adenylate/guanylate cyclase domain-containing protein n=1 Tax=Tateyamaria sp. TaxID=1929288 RepID=UPI00329D3FD2
MSENRDRKLAAILAADVVDYSRLVAEDEEGTVRAFRVLRETIVDPIIEKFGGRIANTAGDSLLVEFASVVEAVKCAWDIQSGVARYNSANGSGREILFRIGVNVGDVIANGQDLLGDGVNVAARLEAIADPGGIIVSKAVADYAKGKTDFYFHPLGSKRLKNIDRPVEVYSAKSEEPVPENRRTPLLFAAFAVILALGAGLFFWLSPFESKPSGPPRIAVLALDDHSAGDDKGWLSDGIAEGIITELASYREFLVLARNSSFSFRDKPTDITDIATQLNADYVVEGSQQKSQDRLRVTVQLIDGHDGTHIWADEFDADIDELFEVQSRIVRSIATQIGSELTSKPPPSGGREKVNALHWYLTGVNEFQKRTPEARRAAAKLFEQSIEADPDAPFGYAGMATLVYFDLLQGWVYPDVPRNELIRRGIEFAEKALDVDPTFYESHIARGDLHLAVGEHEDAVKRYQMALELNPSSSEAMAVANDPLLYLGRADEAVALLERAIDINPITPSWYFNELSRAYWAVGRCDDGLEAIKRRPTLRAWDYRAMIVNLTCLGETAEAQKVAGKLLELDPDFTVSKHGNQIRETINNPEFLERWLNGLRAAGLPEN